jgi:hypothetical protein
MQCTHRRYHASVVERSVPFGHNFEKIGPRRITAIDLPYSVPCHCRMARLGPRRGTFARAWFAGLLAWLLAFQGLVAALPQEHATQPAAGHALMLKRENCGAPRSHDPAAPCHHLPCACCMLCFSGHGEGELALFAVPAIIFTAFSFKGTAPAIAWRLASTLAKPPSGFISSWSQRAPPRFS